MPWGAALTLVGTAYSADQAGDAADASASGAREARNLTQKQFEQTRNDLAPYRVAGDQATGIISRVLGLGGADPDFSDFYESPDYQFRVNEGNKALDRSAASRGMLLSGAQLKAGQRFNQDLASTEFGNWFNRLNTIMQGGQNAAVQTGSFGANAANAAGGYTQNAANYGAQGIYDRTNAVTGGLQDLGGFLGEYMQNKRQSSSGYLDPNIYRGDVPNNSMNTMYG